MSQDALHGSYRDVIVSNNPALLTAGTSADLAIGQLGIFNYDPKKDRTATATPDYRVNKAIQIILGTPPVPTNLLGAVADASKVSKPIRGRDITSWSAKAAQRGQNQVWAVGYDGFDTTKTLTAQCEEHKTVFLKLSGGPIDQIFHTEGRGLVRQYSIFSGCCDDCGNDCATVAAEAMADDLVNQINTDPILSLGGATTAPYTENTFSNRLVRAKKIVDHAAPSPDATATQYLLTVCDSGDDIALGAVQAQAPSGLTVIRLSRLGSDSTYQVIVPTGQPAPAAFNNQVIPIIVDCPSCPAGYTLSTGQFIAEIQRQDTGDATALTTLKTNYGISGSQTAVRIKYQLGQSTYIVTTTAEITSPFVITDFVSQLGITRDSCVLTSPSTTAWVAGLTFNAFLQEYTIDLQDNICGVSRLAELQAQYPGLVITDLGAGTGDASCVHGFSTEVLSNFVEPDCPPDAPIWIAPDPYLGISWTPVPAAETNTVVGVTVEGAYVDLIASECAFLWWRYDAEPIFIEISQHSQDYNDQPTICAGDWPTTEIQPIKIPSGVGSQVREQEAFFKGYDRKFQDVNPIVRQYQDSLLQTDPMRFYDQYTIGFRFGYHASWFSEKYTDHYRLEIYFPEGTGGAFQTAINTYVVSAGLDLDPVAIV